eukprot:scaffold618_cov372-Prasinococcus_capsulatus_cf.AAC.5
MQNREVHDAREGRGWSAATILDTPAPYISALNRICPAALIRCHPPGVPNSQNVGSEMTTVGQSSRVETQDVHSCRALAKAAKSSGRSDQLEATC